MAILAQYTIRSKQSFIFRTNAMREISGASALIRDAWKVLFEEAEKAGLNTDAIPENRNASFDIRSTFDKGAQLIDLFRGGGNDTVLFSDMGSMILANAAFTHALLKECPGMIPMCVGVYATEDYRQDYQNLMEASEREKNRMAPGQSLAMAPFSMMDRKTFQPITCVRMENQRRQEMTAEAEAKLGQYRKDKKKQLGDELDEIGRLLAVVHADGNNMGRKIMELLGNKTSYAECVPLMRIFTDATAKAFTGEGDNEPKKMLDTYAEKKGAEAIKRGEANDYIVRWIVHDGDDATFVCNAKRALELTEKYLKAVYYYKDSSVMDSDGRPFNYNSCAGICMFHSHYPFSMAYAMAEEACDNAKEKVHIRQEKSDTLRTDDSLSEINSYIEQSWIDFHFIHSGLNNDLKELRYKQRTADCMARPWAVEGQGLPEKPLMTKKLGQLADSLRLFHGVTRTNIKSLGAAWERSRAEGIAELHRVYSHTYCANALKEKLNQLFENDEADQMRAIYDLAEVYDLWFRPRLEAIAVVLEFLEPNDKKVLQDLKEAKAADMAQGKQKPDLSQLTHWHRIIELFVQFSGNVATDRDGGDILSMAEMKAEKALYDLVEIEGWDGLVREGE